MAAEGAQKLYEACKEIVQDEGMIDRKESRTVFLLWFKFMPEITKTCERIRTQYQKIKRWLLKIFYYSFPYDLLSERNF